MDGDAGTRRPAGEGRGMAAQRPAAGSFRQIEASRARLVTSRDLCRDTDMLIGESRATIARSLARLNSPSPAPIAPA